MTCHALNRQRRGRRGLTTQVNGLKGRTESSRPESQLLTRLFGLSGLLFWPQSISIVQQDGHLTQHCTCSTMGQQAEVGARWRRWHRPQQCSTGMSCCSVLFAALACTLQGICRNEGALLFRRLFFASPARNCHVGLKRIDRWDKSAERWTAKD